MWKLYKQNSRPGQIHNNNMSYGQIHTPHQWPDTYIRSFVTDSNHLPASLEYSAYILLRVIPSVFNHILWTKRRHSSRTCKRYWSFSGVTKTSLITQWMCMLSVLQKICSSQRDSSTEFPFSMTRKIITASKSFKASLNFPNAILAHARL